MHAIKTNYPHRSMAGTGNRCDEYSWFILTINWIRTYLHSGCSRCPFHDITQLLIVFNDHSYTSSVLQSSTQLKGAIFQFFRTNWNYRFCQMKYLERYSPKDTQKISLMISSFQQMLTVPPGQSVIYLNCSKPKCKTHVGANWTRLTN